jgi:glycosyltransferase involved in cell wall biosynthesis
VPKVRLVAQMLSSLVPAARDSVGLVRYIKRAGIDVIHCAEAPRDVFYGLLLSRVTGAKCVAHVHVKYNDWISPLSRWAIHRADAVIGISDYASEHVRQAGVSPRRIFTVYNGIDVSGWDPRMIDGTTVRREFEVDRDTTLLVIVGNLHPWKRHSLLLEALSRVVRTRPNLKLLIVGKEEEQVKGLRSGSQTDQLKRQVSEAGLERHVVFTGQRRDVPHLLAAADIFTMPAYEEPFGNVFLEAMAMAKPIVALRSGGTPEVVNDGKAGLLCPADDSARLAENIIELVDHPDRRREMGAYGRRSVLESFTAQRMADGVEQVYRAIIHK